MINQLKELSAKYARLAAESERNGDMNMALSYLSKQVGVLESIEIVEQFRANEVDQMAAERGQ